MKMKAKNGSITKNENGLYSLRFGLMNIEYKTKKEAVDFRNKLVSAKQLIIEK